MIRLALAASFAVLLAAGADGVCLPENVCGNGRREVGEECDYLDRQGCSALQRGSGPVDACFDDCTADTTACSGNLCVRLPDRALAWYRAEPLAAFGGRTAESLVTDGKATAVRDYLDHVATGGFA